MACDARPTLVEWPRLGIFSLDRDVEEITQCITYIRDKLFKDPNLSIVLMGHSTGCQDIMRYLTAPNPLNERQGKRPIVQGAILQAPVSDRDSVMHTVNENPEAKKAYEAAMEIIQGTPKKEHRDVLLPMNLTRSFFGSAPLSIARFLSLLSPSSPENPSVEDFFSSDLSDATLQSTFGKIGRNGLLSRSNQPDAAQSVLVLMSDSDEHAHPRTSQRDLLDRWRGLMREETAATVHGDSAVILNAVHDVGGDDWPSQEARLVVLRRKVLRYLKDVVGEVDAHADEIWHKDGDRVTALKSGDGRKVEEIVGELKL